MPLKNDIPLDSAIDIKRFILPKVRDSCSF
jgi:hypothetical protein